MFITKWQNVILGVKKFVLSWTHLPVTLKKASVIRLQALVISCHTSHTTYNKYMETKSRLIS